MNNKQLTAMRIAMQHVSKPECTKAASKIYAGEELDSGDCRALLVACARSAITDETEVKELAEHFFERYGFDCKVKVSITGRVEFI